MGEMRHEGRLSGSRWPMEEQAPFAPLRERNNEALKVDGGVHELEVVVRQLSCLQSRRHAHVAFDDAGQDWLTFLRSGLDQSCSAGGPFNLCWCQSRIGRNVLDPLRTDRDTF